MYIHRPRQRIKTKQSLLRTTLLLPLVYIRRKMMIVEIVRNPFQEMKRIMDFCGNVLRTDHKANEGSMYSALPLEYMWLCMCAYIHVHVYVFSWVMLMFLFCRQNERQRTLICPHNYTPVFSDNLCFYPATFILALKINFKSKWIRISRTKTNWADEGKRESWITRMGGCLAVFKWEVKQWTMFLDKCRYALLNEKAVKYRLSKAFFF